jgi:hypothetical protein
LNYIKTYNNIIIKAQSRNNVNKKYESHHIIPRSIGGIDDSSNLVQLTLKEHFIAHLLLAKIYGGKLYYAAFMMSNFKKYNSKQYSWIRNNLTMSEAHKKKISLSTIGRKHSEETKKKMSNAKKGKSRLPEHILKTAQANTGKTRTTETKEKMSIWQKGKSFTIEHKQKLKENHKGMTGKTFSKESKLKMSISQLNQPIQECPYCKQTGKGNAMYRWHFENCKYNI